MRSEDEAAAALLPPVKSVWEEAVETCPVELATPEAYEVYKVTNCGIYLKLLNTYCLKCHHRLKTCVVI